MCSKSKSSPPRSHKNPFPPKGEVSLMRALSKCGLASRTQASLMIEAGEVMVDGKICKNPLFWVNPQKVKITIGEKQAKPSATRILLLYKTKGTITTKKDPEGRPTVFDLLPEEFHDLKPVGRLDQHTSGLLLFTSNNQLLNYLLDPESEIEREYDISVEGLLENTEPLLRGIENQGELLRLKACNIRKQSRRETHLKVILNEGKNREIRRIFEASGHKVTRILRTKYGPFSLDGLNYGQHRLLSAEETKKFKKLLDEARPHLQELP